MMRWSGGLRGSRRCYRFPTLALGMALGAVLMAGACTARIDQQGNKPDEDQVVQINPGIDDKNRVAELLGYPSTVSTFNDNTWYYISKRTKTIAFWEPDVLDQEVLQISFDNSGIVQDMKIYGQQDGETIAYVDRKTPTPGNDLTILQQLFGNLGKFNTDKLNKGSGAPGGGP
ncbi:MAG: outer membrane protein assembly factor BamE [Rhodospirillaceae bacterium]|nr:MAG: outer membrane protein assembly factor BamE [Rhodospirillaceae bacterium]